MVKQMKLQKSLTLKALITLMTVAITLVSILVVVIMSIYNLNKVFQNMEGDKCDKIVTMMNLYVDPVQLEDSIQKQGIDDGYLAQLQEQLYKAKTSMEIEYIYIVEDAGTDVAHVVDGSYDANDPDYSTYGDPEAKSEYAGIEDAFTKGVKVTSEIYSYVTDNGQKQSLISTYLPIKGSNGQVLAVLGCDINVNQNMADLQNTIILFITALIVLVIIAAVIAIFLSIRMFRPLSGIVEHVQELSKGDFTVHYDYNKNNEVGRINQSFMYLTDSLQKMFATIVGSSTSLEETVQVLDSSTEQIVISIQGVNEAVNHIAMSASEQTEYTRVGMENMESLRENVALNNTNLEELINTLGTVTVCKDQGLKTIAFLKNQSEVSNQTLQKMGSDIRNTNESVSYIGAASTTIKNIASQTNLLALNASIEAARAGEAGRGFAVVAEEIRKLSEESNASADKISRIIDSLMANSENMVRTMDEMSVTMDEQVKSVNQTQDNFEQISVTIDTTHESLKNLAASSTSMERSEKNLVEIFTHIIQSIDANAASTEEVSASMSEQTAIIEEIATIAKRLTHETKKLEESLKVFTFL